MPAELETAPRHLAHLYEVSKVLANYQGGPESLADVFAVAAHAVPLEILVLVERANGQIRPSIELASRVAPAQALAALAKARRSLEYYPHDGAAPPAGDVSVPGGPIVLPLAVDRKVIGVLYVETAPPLDEVGLAFVSAVSGLLAVASDRNNAKNSAQAAIRSRDDVLAVVSHDLGNMLTSILLSTQLADESSPAVDRRRFGGKTFRLIQRSAQRMNLLLHDLLDTASLDGNRISMSCASHPVAPLIAEAIEQFRGQAEDKKLVLASDVASALPPIFVDRNRVLQVLSNLIGNAIKFTPAGGRVEVRAVPLTDEISVAVRDTGTGISSAQQPHVFDRFWQARRTGRLGTGLGLFIAKSIVEMLGGRIWVESIEGTGTTFTFTLPIATPAQESGKRRDPHRAEQQEGEHLEPRYSRRR